MCHNSTVSIPFVSVLISSSWVCAIDFLPEGIIIEYLKDKVAIVYLWEVLSWGALWGYTCQVTRHWTIEHDFSQLRNNFYFWRIENGEQVSNNTLSADIATCWYPTTLKMSWRKLMRNYQKKKNKTKQKQKKKRLDMIRNKTPSPSWVPRKIHND